MLFEIITALLVVLALHYWWSVRHFSKRNIPYSWPIPILGTNCKIFTSRQIPFMNVMKNYYDEFKGHPFCGMFEFTTPLIMIRDPEIIKNITVKDFEHFTDHRVAFPEDVEPLMGRNVFGLKGHEWKSARNLLTPAFTGSKMKNMFHLVSECGKQLSDHVYKLQQQEGVMVTIELKDLFTRYGNDVIATCAFGLSCDSLQEKDNKFYQMGRKATNLSGITLLRLILSRISTKIMKLIGMTILPKDATDFFRQLIYDTLRMREEKNIVRPDMLHLLMEARKVQKELTDEEIAAHAFGFFFGGFDTTSTLMCFVILLLAMHPEKQKKLQDHIDETFRDETFTYEDINGLTYLDNVISETLRLYPPAPTIDRKCVKTYTIPATEDRPELKIEEGEYIYLPYIGLHMDPDYFPDPESFQPERFSEENKHNIKPYTYLPFGVGPRSCIGNRFALMETKTALVYLLSRFDFHVTDKTPLPIKVTNAMQLEGGFWIGLTPRNESTSHFHS